MERRLPRFALALLALLALSAGPWRAGASPDGASAPPGQALNRRRVDIHRLRLARRAAATAPGTELPGLVALVEEGGTRDVREQAGRWLLDACVLHPGVEEPSLVAALRAIYLGSPDPQLKERALLALLSRDLGHLPAAHRGRFLAAILPDVLRASRAARLPPSVTLAQAILESGWGRSRLAREHHNLFGVKAGASAPRVRMATTEVGPDGPRPAYSAFRTFASPGAAIAQHAALLGRDARYAAARAHRDDWRAFLARLAPYYATDPRYAERVADLVVRYRLDRWDGLIAAAVEADQA
ncbi:MAG: glucosaminidase domain-containing protein [Pseudomonadota bacterium]